MRVPWQVGSAAYQTFVVDAVANASRSTQRAQELDGIADVIVAAVLALTVLCGEASGKFQSCGEQGGDSDAH